MQRSDTFCSVPWFEVHINADGTYHTCGAQPNHMTGSDLAKTYCVQNMTIEQWMDSQWQRRSRLDKLNGHANNLCNMCYHEEAMGSSSKRHRENLKSGIAGDDFSRTWSISPDRSWFEYSLEHDGESRYPNPTSYHLSLGNECNLACRMCGPAYSSRIAAEMKQAGHWIGPARLNWTDDDRAWARVVDTMCATRDLQWVHVIGGEPMMNPRFHDLIRRLLDAGLTDIYFGFTTNGMLFDQDIMRALSRFRHVDIGVSVECMGPLNDAIRRGSDYQQVLHNLERYAAFRVPGRVYVTLRTVPSALSVHTLDQLYAWCLDREIDVMSNMLTQPEHMAIQHLPRRIKDRLLAQYGRWAFAQQAKTEGDPRDPTRYRQHIDQEIRAIQQALASPGDPVMTDMLYRDLDRWGWLQSSPLCYYFLELDDQ